MSEPGSQNDRELTLGERRVRLSFNPSGNTTVDQLKRAAADFIDHCHALRQLAVGRDPDTSAEMHRLLSLAQTHAEDAAMWAVKAATA
jgi:hypothetical protein